jgi:hypothetical protein
MPYVTLVGDGVTPSAIPAYNDVHHNMIVANYAADGGCLDNDDGSAWYKIHDNACIFGGEHAGARTRAIPHGAAVASPHARAHARARARAL